MIVILLFVILINMVFIIIQASYINELEEIIDELNEGEKRHE